MSDVSAAQAVVGLVMVVRLVEFWISRRRAELRLADGAEEIAGDLHVATAMFHAAWLVALAFLTEGATRLEALWLGPGIALLALRAYRLLRLPADWSLRLFRQDRPPMPAAERGHHLMRDPSYLPMLAELLVLPLIFGLWWFSLAGTALYAVLAWQRLAAEGLR
jgi:methyltransferase